MIRARAACLVLTVAIAGLAGPAQGDPSPDPAAPSTLAPNGPASKGRVQAPTDQASIARAPSGSAPVAQASDVETPKTSGQGNAATVPPATSGNRAPAASVQNVPAQAQTPPAPGAEESGRYTFHRIGDGFVRLDSTTGQLAQCGWGPAGWSCKAAPDERTALESEIARLQRENAELKKSLLARGIELPAGVVAQAPAPPPVPPADVPDPSSKEPRGPKEFKPPSEADIDRALSFMKNVWRKLVDMMVDLQRDIQKKS
jgi:hypothetical protein